jgi:hypothetical protein
VDYQFFNEPPKEVPHGYTCAYIPDSSNPVCSIQQVVGEFLGWMLISKLGWLSTPPGQAMITYTRPQELKLWIKSAQS